MALEFFNIQGLDSFDNPLQPNLDGQLIHAVNVVNFPQGALSKRPGYTTFLGTPDNAQVNGLMWYPQQSSGTNLYLYRASGSQFYYSQQGTGAWTLVQGSSGGDAGGTIVTNSRMGGTTLNNVFICGDSGTTRHTTNGTVFTNTTGAPASPYWANFHQRVYAASGTQSAIVACSAGDATNWNIGGTSNSYSQLIDGDGLVQGLAVAGDRLVITKNRGRMYEWDDTTLSDLATNLGPTMPFAIGQIDDLLFYPNQLGIFSFDGATKNMLSNSVQRQFYNRQGSGISGTMFGTAGVGQGHLWDYLMTEGTITDDFTGRTINNALLKYDYQKNTFLNWQFNDFPTAMLSYIDQNNIKQLIFGNSSGQCFQLTPTATSDNGKAIESEAVFVFSYASQSTAFSPTSAQTSSGITWEKKWNWWRGFFNPGCELNIQFAFSNTLTYQHLTWSEVLNIKPNARGFYWQESDGKVELRFPDNENNPRRSTFLFIRVYEMSDSASWTYYGCQIDAEPIAK